MTPLDAVNPGESDVLAGERLNAKNNIRRMRPRLARHAVEEIFLGEARDGKIAGQRPLGNVGVVQPEKRVLYMTLFIKRHETTTRLPNLTHHEPFKTWERVRVKGNLLHNPFPFPYLLMACGLDAVAPALFGVIESLSAGEHVVTGFVGRSSAGRC